MPGRWPVFASESRHPPKSWPICGLRGVWTHMAHIGCCVACLDPRVQVEDGHRSGRGRGGRWELVPRSPHPRPAIGEFWDGGIIAAHASSH